MHIMIGLRRWSFWLSIGLAVTGCGTPAVSQSTHSPHAGPGVAAGGPGQGRTQLAQELHEHAAYLNQLADKREQQADDLAKKVGPEDESVIFRTRSLAYQIRKQAEEAEQKATALDAAVSDRIEDHAMMARFYQQESERLAGEAEKYAEEAAAIDPLQDPKGLRRGELLTAAQQHRKQAAEMNERAARHGANTKP
jgi:hypothetical protein